MELKPCPFCGSEPNIIAYSSYGYVHYYVKCTDCGAKTQPVLAQERLLQLWNTRATDLHICSLCGNDERVAKLAKMLGLRPDVAFMKLNHTNTLLKEMAEALEEIVRCLSHGLQDCRASVVAKAMLQKYHDRKEG